MRTPGGLGWSSVQREPFRDLASNEVAVDKVPFSYLWPVTRFTTLANVNINNTIHVDMAVQLY